MRPKGSFLLAATMLGNGKRVRGVGLMIGIELVEDFAERARSEERAPSLFMVDRLHAAGLLTVPSRTHVLRWLPPLNVRREEIDEALQILSDVLTRLTTM